MTRFDSTRSAAVFFVMALGALSAFAADGTDIRSLMTAQEFNAAGLSKLSTEELEALNLWLVRYTVKDAPVLIRKDPGIRAEIKKSETAGIKSRIAGEFQGWTGDTLFQLENGQVWRQRLPGRWVTRRSSPEVEIKKNMLGFWVLRVIEDGKIIGVTGPE